MPEQLSAIALAVFAAALMGFAKTALPAAAILSVALMAAAFDDNAQLSVGAMLPILLVGDVFAVAWFRRHAQWDRLWALAPFVAAGMIPAFFVLAWFPENKLRPVLGWLVLGLLLLELGRTLWHGKTAPHGWWFSAIVGSLAGFGTMVGNAGGPAMNVYLLSRGMLKEQFVGTCAWFFFLLNLSKVLPFWRQGMLPREALTFGAWMIPAVVAGGALGVWALPRLPQRAFNAAAWLLAGAAAVWLIAW